MKLLLILFEQKSNQYYKHSIDYSQNAQNPQKTNAEAH
jgi:hypothetical protein